MWEKNLVIIVKKKVVGGWYTMVIMDSILWRTCMWKTMDSVFIQHGNDGFFRQTCVMMNTTVIDVFVVVYQHGRS